MLFSSKNKKVIGKFKDEFIGFKSKSYAYKYIDNNNIEGCDNKLKGIKKNIIKDTINFKNYFNCLTLKKEEY